MSSVGPRVPALTILSHPDVDRVGERAVLWEAEAVQGEALLARRQLAFQPPRGGRPRTLDDPYLSRRPIRLTAARFGGIRIDCTRSGTRMTADSDWISEDRVFLGVEIERGVVLVLSERLALLLHNLEPSGGDNPDSSTGDAPPTFGLVGESSAMQRLRRRIRSLTDAGGLVLLRGEAGTGKKRVARAIHQAGGKDRPYVTVRLVDEPSPPPVSPASLSPALISPASISPALISPALISPASISDVLSQAAGGTLVLDAVHRMSAELQVRLLQELADPRCDVRLLATHIETRSGGAPGPLLEKLDWTLVEVPALSSRRDDIGRLVFHFLRRQLAELDASDRLADPGSYAAPWLPGRLVAALARHEWPSNVSQLRRTTERLAHDYYDRDHVDAHLDLEVFVDRDPESSSMGWSDDSQSSTPAPAHSRELSEAEVLSALRANRWQAEPAAGQLGVAPDVLFNMMEKMFNHGQLGKPRR